MAQWHKLARYSMGSVSVPILETSASVFGCHIFRGYLCTCPAHSVLCVVSRVGDGACVSVCLLWPAWHIRMASVYGIRMASGV
jgi:hypothetical protein